MATQTEVKMPDQPGKPVVLDASERVFLRECVEMKIASLNRAERGQSNEKIREAYKEMRYQAARLQDKLL